MSPDEATGQGQQGESGHEKATTASVVDRSSAEKVEQMADTLIGDWQQDLQLRRDYAKWALRFMLGQVLLADVVFIVYAFIVYAFIIDWRVPNSVMVAWLGATVVQVVAVTLVVARGLFPPRPR